MMVFLLILLLLIGGLVLALIIQRNKFEKLKKELNDAPGFLVDEEIEPRFDKNTNQKVKPFDPNILEINSDVVFESSSKDGIFVIENWVLVYVSANLYKRYSPYLENTKLIRLENLYSLVSEADKVMVQESVEKALERKQTYLELKFKAVDSESTSYRKDALFFLYNQAGKLTRTIIFTRDETEFENLKSRLSYIEILKEYLFNYFNGYVFCKNSKGEFLFVNDAVVQDFNITLEEIIGKTDAELVDDPEIINKYRVEDEKVINTGKSLFIENEPGIRGDGTLGYFQTSKVPLEIPGEEGTCVLVFTRDITDEVKNNIQLKEKALLADKLNNITFGLTFLDFLESDSVFDVTKKISESLIQGLELDSGAVWLITNNEIKVYFYEKNNIVDISEPEVLNLDEWLEYMMQFNDKLVVEVSDTSIIQFKNPAIKAYFENKNIKSKVDIPLRIGSNLIGGLCCATSEIREWKHEEILFGQHIGNYFLASYEFHAKRKAENKLLAKSRILEGVEKITQLLYKNDNLEDCIHQIVEVLGESTNVCRAYYFNLLFEINSTETIAIWDKNNADDIAELPFITEFSTSHFEFLVEKLKLKKPHVYEEKTIENDEIKRLLQMLGIKTMVLIPIFINDKLNSVIGFDRRISNDDWDEDSFLFLQTLASNISAAIERSENTKLIAENHFNLQLISDTVKDVFWLFDVPNKKFLFVSKACKEVFGYDENDYNKNPEIVEENVLREDFHLIKERKWKHKNNQVCEITYRIKRPDGEVRHISEKTFPILGENGEVIKVSGVSVDVTEQIKINKEVALLSTVTQKIYNSVLISDPDGTVTWVNNAFIKLFKTQFDRVVGKKISQLLKSRGINKSVNFTKDNSINNYDEIEFVDKNGEIVWISVAWSVVKNEQGQIIQYISIVNNITKRKQAELLISNSERSLRFITDNTSDGFIVIKNSRIQHYSASCERIFGFKVDDIVGNPSVSLFDYVEEKEKLKVMGLVNKSVEERGKVLEFQTKLRNFKGEYQWYEIVPNILYNEDDSLESVILVIRNIDSRKKMELALSQSQKHLNLILNSLDEMVWAMTYPHLEPVFVSNSISEIYEISTEEWRNDIKSTLKAVIPEDKEVLKNIYAELDINNESQGNYRIKTRSGAIKWLKSNTKIIHDSETNKRLLIGVISDITKIKEAEKFAKESILEKQQAESAFAELELRALQMQMNPHFIFNALNAIQSYIINKEEEFANIYLSKFASLIRLFLDSSRSKYISISEEIKMLKLYADLEKLRFENKFEVIFIVDPAINIFAEIPTMLLQPFIENSINHGLRYKKEKGSLTVEFKNISDYVKVTIKDDGVGRAKSDVIRKKTNQGYKSQGLKITTQRLENYNKLNMSNIDFKIEDLYPDKEDKGTLVEILFPIN
jgi:PAS domain S-box-containing protein